MPRAERAAAGEPVVFVPGERLPRGLVRGGGMPRGERAAVAADLKAQERGPGLTTTGGGRTSPGYLRGLVSPDGEPVVFVPGELLPGWALVLIDAGRLEEISPKVFTVHPVVAEVPSTPRPRRKAVREVGDG